jgi:hypothetical protein
MNATFLAKLDGFRGDARLYQLDVPLEGSTYVVVSQTRDTPITGPETYIFPSDPDGNIRTWSELPGSTKGVCSHEEVLSYAGYEVSNA